MHIAQVIVDVLFGGGLAFLLVKHFYKQQVLSSLHKVENVELKAVAAAHAFCTKCERDVARFIINHEGKAVCANCEPRANG